MVIPANIPFPLSASFGAPSLFAGMKAFDVSTGTPVQITGKPGQINGVYPMAQVASSNSYQASFTGAPGHAYLFLFDVYTDGTYAAVDGSYPEQSLAAAAEFLAPVFVQGLKIMVGCEDQLRQSPVRASQASDQSVVLSFEDEHGKPVDVTSATAIEMDVLEADGVTVLAKTLGSGITPVSGSPNQALVQYLAADLALFPTGYNDAKVKLSIGGQNLAFNVYSALDIQPDPT